MPVRRPAPIRLSSYRLTPPSPLFARPRSPARVAAPLAAPSLLGPLLTPFRPPKAPTAPLTPYPHPRTCSTGGTLLLHSAGPAHPPTPTHPLTCSTGGTPSVPSAVNTNMRPHSRPRRDSCGCHMRRGKLPTVTAATVREMARRMAGVARAMSRYSDSSHSCGRAGPHGFAGQYRMTAQHRVPRVHQSVTFCPVGTFLKAHISRYSPSSHIRRARREPPAMLLKVAEALVCQAPRYASVPRPMRPAVLLIHDSAGQPGQHSPPASVTRTEPAPTCFIRASTVCRKVTGEGTKELHAGRRRTGSGGGSAARHAPSGEVLCDSVAAPVWHIRDRQYAVQDLLLHGRLWFRHSGGFRWRDCASGRCPSSCYRCPDPCCPLSSTVFIICPC